MTDKGTDSKGNLRTYALLVSLASVVGALLTVVPLVRAGLEYRSPEVVVDKSRPELASVESFARSQLGKASMEGERFFYYELNHRSSPPDWWRESQHGKWSGLSYRAAAWHAAYDLALAAHAEEISDIASRNHSRAKHSLFSYGTLLVLCLGLLVTHLFWAKRLIAREK